MEAPPPPREFLAAAPTTFDGDRLALSVSSDLIDPDNAVLIFDTGGDSWTEQEGGDGSIVSAIAIAENQLVSLEPAGDTGRFERPLSPSGPIPPVVGAVVSLDLPVHEWNVCGAACNGGDREVGLILVATRS